MTSIHAIGREDLTAIARGAGGPAAVRLLWSGQHSKRLLLLRVVLDNWPAGAPGRDRAVAAITAAEESSPAEVRDVLVDPMVGAWSAVTVRRLRRGTAEPADLGHLAALATVAALRAGTSAGLDAYARDGWLNLPTIGRVRAPVSDGPVELVTHDGRLLVNGYDAAGWQLRRSLVVGASPALEIALEDLDPYRDIYDLPAADRLAEDEAGQWRRYLAGAWRMLCAHASERAAEISAGLRCLVPLAKPDVHCDHSATSTEAVGVVGLDRPRTTADLAVALVHEFQHSKLSAVLDIVPLYRKSDRTFFAPWRSDLRPIGGLFQGVYAFLGVADTWRALCADPATSPRAVGEFATVREQVTDAVTTLDRSDLLTSAGQQFVAGMTEAIEDLHAVAVPGAVVDLARSVLENRRRQVLQ
jgi:HEXXH motif-containing protein